MALIKAAVSLLTIAVANPHKGGMVCTHTYNHQIKVNPAAGDILEVGILPAGCRIVDLILDADELDTDATPTLAFDVGLMSGEVGSEDPARTCDAVFFANSTVGQTGAIARPTLKTAFRVAPIEQERSIGVKFIATAETFVTGKIGLTVIYASA